MIQKLSGAVLILFNGLLLILFVPVLYLQFLEVYDLHDQENRNLPEKAGVRRFSDRLNDPGLRLNDVQILGTHNSYKRMITVTGSLFVAAGSSREAADSLQYGYRPLTEQLNEGIRGLEIDLRYSGGKFLSLHVPLVDSRSNAPDFAVTLRQLRKWSEQNKNHFPVLILIELKNDWTVLDPGSEEITEISLNKLDHLIEENLGSVLYKPSHLTGNQMSVRSAVAVKGWPLISELRGRMLFYLHPGDYSKMYASSEHDRAMFSAVYAQDSNLPYAGFIVHNEPDEEVIGKLTDSGFIVRTRLDKDLKRDPARVQRALESGAQILMTDFAPGRENPAGEPVLLDNAYTVRVKE